MRQRWQALSINRKNHRADGYRIGNIRIYYVGTYIVSSMLRLACGQVPDFLAPEGIHPATCAN